MNCPRCNQNLHVSAVDGIEIDVCLACKGVWFDNDELRQAKDLSEPDANWMDFDIWKHEDNFHVSAGKIKCPRCRKPLCALSYDETAIEVDVCPSCRGVWLDDAELAHIVEALNSQINSKTFPEYIPAAIKEALEILTGSESLVSEWKDFRQVLRLMNQRLYVEHPKLYQTMEDVQRVIPSR